MTYGTFNHSMNALFPARCDPGRHMLRFITGWANFFQPGSLRFYGEQSCLLTHNEYVAQMKNKLLLLAEIWGFKSFPEHNQAYHN